MASFATGFDDASSPPLGFPRWWDWDRDRIEMGIKRYTARGVRQRTLKGVWSAAALAGQSGLGQQHVFVVCGRSSPRTLGCVLESRMFLEH